MDAELAAVLRCILIPFAGTTLGAACVFLLKGDLRPLVHRALTGFAAGVMVAASVWSLLVPALDQSSHMGALSFVPAFAGLWAGVLFLLLLDKLVPHIHADCDECEGLPSKWSRSTKFILAVTLHNVPEGMAVGVVCAGLLTYGLGTGDAGGSGYTEAAALALALGLAIQNFPEGAIVSMPLRGEGYSKPKAFAMGALSGAVEPVAAALTVLAASLVAPALPYLLGFAAGAMLYVVVEELIPQMSRGSHSNVGTLLFAAGFSLMMVLDVALG